MYENNLGTFIEIGTIIMVKKMPYNELRKAIAESYSQEEKAIAMKSRSELSDLAERIAQAALESDIPIIENQGLLKEIAKYDFMEELPENLLKAVGEIISYFRSMDAQLGMDSQILTGD